MKFSQTFLEQFQLFRPNEKNRRAHLLTMVLGALLLLLVTMLVFVLVINYNDLDRLSTYTVIIILLIALFSFALWLNHKGRYYISALITVTTAIVGPWSSLFFDPAILRGDFVPLVHIALSILLSSVLLPPTYTILVASAQWVGLIYLSVFVVSGTVLNWPSFLAFFFFLTTLSLLSNFVIEQDIQEIHEQARILSIREKQLKEESIRDHLTGLFNRRYLDETLERELHRAERNQSSLGVIMLDIDHFKVCNDTYGHAAGDVFLVELGKILKTTIRHADIACRYGGEEFLLILPDAVLDVVLDRAENIRMQAAALRVDYNGVALDPLTISVGVSMFPQHATTCTSLIKAADDALYQAKRTGRDRIVVAKTVGSISIR
jgi:diguanylate cyclase (GGDEF)-like protein